MDDEQLRAAAMEYHREPTPGKISIAPTKGLTNQHEIDPSLIVEGEMRGDAALAKSTLDGLFPGTRLPNEANLLVMPNIDAANISYNLLKVAAGNGITVGPILLGTAKPVHILEPGVSVRRIVNMTALAVVDASHSQQA